MVQAPTPYTRRIPEFAPTHPLAGRLGRNVYHDSRSRDYPFPAQVVKGVKSVRHKRIIQVLDQGLIGSCTGNAEEGALGSLPFYDVIPATHPRKPTGDAEKDEEQAVQFYSEATHLDSFDGEFPPEDTGSNGLAVNKAAKNAGLISGYQHCFSLDSALKALSVQPVITGVNWYSSFDEPDSSGRVSITPDADVRGGHEFTLDEIIVEDRLIGATNSWGYSYGLDGRFFITWDDFERLMHEEGDVTVPLPLDQAPPVPITTDTAPGCLPKFLQRFAHKL